MEQEKKKWYNYLGITKKEKDDAEDDIVGPLNLKNFFKLFKRKIGKLLSVNLYIVVEAIPVAAVLLAMIWGPYVYSPDNAAFSVIFGTMRGSGSPVDSILLGVFGATRRFPVYTPGMIVLFLALALVFLLIFGPINVGSTYILRNLVRREPVFMWSDFRYAIKRNLKQGILFGMLDALLVAILTFDLVYFYKMLGASFFTDLMFFVTLFLAIIYFFMRFYIYIIMVTFDLSIRKILKNSLIFAILGFKRNIMALLGMILMIVLNYILLYVLMPFNIMFPLILPVFYLLGFGSFMAAYAAYPKIEQYMIKPYEKTPDNTSEK